MRVVRNMGGRCQFDWQRPPITTYTYFCGFLRLPAKRSPLPYTELAKPCRHMTQPINDPIPSLAAYSAATRNYVATRD